MAEMDLNVADESSLLKETKSLLRSFRSPLFISGVILGAGSTWSITHLIMNILHEASLSEFRTKYEISMSEFNVEVMSKDEELKRQKWEYSKLTSDFEGLNKSFNELSNKYKSALDFHYNYCKEQVRSVKLSHSAYQSMKQAIQFDTPQSPIEHALYNVYTLAEKCVNRFEN
ncbi:hypothetical protein GCM10009098_05070 [Rheinheimera aquimaris]|uniref:Transmembrane protein n=1 Tax=Rheinheimera aquimaris TaxID=412437 RepID=A0ABP3NBA1_9GAMM|nr:hypothetical protein [Rheinheimera aquimaris]MCB5212317.1 hypothetical protein [Rheinheimera aquimaris]